MKNRFYFSPLLLGCLVFGTISSNATCSLLGKQRSALLQQPRESKQLLGCIRDGKGLVRYYVVTESYRVQAAKQYHGHSRVVFLNSQRLPVAQYELGLPEELPYKLDDNTLFFGKNLPQSSKHQQQIGNLLPSALCVSPSNCYQQSSIN